MNDVSCENFHRAASAAFEYLKRDYGFWEVERLSARNECWIMLRSATAGVRVAYERGSPIWVELLQLAPQTESLVVLARSSLEMLLDARRQDSHVNAEAAPSTQEELAEALARVAAKLRWYGEDVIRGDFSVMPRLKELEAENLRRRNQELFGGPNGESK